MHLKLPEALTPLAEKPIQHVYSQPSDAEIETLKKLSEVNIIYQGNGLNPVNAYYVAGYAGTQPEVFTRRAVLEKLQTVSAQLAPRYGLMIFDAYRSIETQQYLFNLFAENIQKMHPEWTAQQVDEETRRFVAHPTDRSKFEIPMHNSGGAVDLTVYDMHTGQACYMGADFDATVDASSTIYFEAPYTTNTGFSAEEWLAARHNRRVLFHLLKQEGFINYCEEWWHFDLGDCNWAKELNRDWVYDSMEKEVELLRASFGAQHAC